MEIFSDGSTGQITEFKGVGGLSIAAYLRKPTGEAPFPAVVIMHGGGDSSQATYSLGRMTAGPVARFVAAGWAVYSIDFRPNSSFQAIDWDDACLAVETLRKLPFIDGRRIAMTGNSHGGFNSVRAAARCNLSCVVPSAPAGLDLIEVAKAQKMGAKINQALVRLIQSMEKDYGASVDEIMQNPARFKHESAFTEVEKIRCPMLIISARNDPASPPVVIEAYMQKLKAAGKMVEAYLPETGGHSFYFGRPAITESEEAVRRAVAFIRKHFAAASRSASTGSATDPAPPVCYDITKQFPNEIGQYRVSRAAQPVEPFEIMDGLYYVGNTQMGAHLLKTDDGLILFDTPMPHEVPWLLASIRKLGFDPADVKVAVGNHAHLDHIGGHWYFQQHFGTQTWLHEADAAGTERGAWKPGSTVELDGTLAALSSAYPPFRVDRKLKDGEVIEWGGRRIVFRSAPGHTPGTLMIEIPLRGPDGQVRRAGILGGYAPGRPEFTATCRKLQALDIDIYLGAHPSQSNTLAKAEKLAAHPDQNPFVNSAEWQDMLKKMIARAENP